MRCVVSSFMYYSYRSFLKFNYWVSICFTGISPNFHSMTYKAVLVRNTIYEDVSYSINLLLCQEQNLILIISVWCFLYVASNTVYDLLSVPKTWFHLLFQYQLHLISVWKWQLALIPNTVNLALFSFSDNSNHFLTMISSLSMVFNNCFLFSPEQNTLASSAKISHFNAFETVHLSFK